MNLRYSTVYFLCTVHVSVQCTPPDKNNPDAFKEKKTAMPQPKKRVAVLCRHAPPSYVIQFCLAQIIHVALQRHDAFSGSTVDTVNSAACTLWTATASSKFSLNSVLLHALSVLRPRRKVPLVLWVPPGAPEHYNTTALYQ